MANEYLSNAELEKTIIAFQEIKRDQARYEMIFEDLRCVSPRATARWEPVLKVREGEYAALMLEMRALQDHLAILFIRLAENIIRYRKYKFVDPDDAVQEFVRICFDKLGQFDRRRGKAFNYLTTCIFSHYRQLYRHNRNYEEMKRKYHDHLQSATKGGARRNNSTVGKDKFARSQ